jgi:four helix bundle protein
MDNSNNLILDLTLNFALKIIDYSELLEENRKFVISRQLLKSGTSIGANVREAQNAESKADFIHKFKIAAKEMEETDFWLTLCERSKKYPSVKDLFEDLIVIKKVINKIIGTSKKENNKQI